jgi:ATP phosphoribosyltransferase regulatory subunit HisZ
LETNRRYSEDMTRNWQAAICRRIVSVLYYEGNRRYHCPPFFFFDAKAHDANNVLNDFGRYDNPYSRLGKGVFGLKFSTSRRKIVQTKNRDALAPTTLTAVTSEQIDAYRKLYAEDRKAREKLQTEQGKKPGKKTNGKEYALTTEDETILALAYAVGDHRVKKAGIIETKRRL